ncbi:hypothetical protein OPV22_022748 [Ensete ventricosum]|uniref:Uncharacterized protein n=1 Tax=Ensete ventricosum TaxID=4639 RepID=A0AAV8QK96_ENSVE|nr:hypothetical protein OPV22_022748 [Ensete ventricosum]
MVKSRNKVVLRDFLSFKPGIPKSLLMDGPHTLQSHFSLVNYQLRQIRTALAVASPLNRTLNLDSIVE